MAANLAVNLAVQRAECSAASKAAQLADLTVVLRVAPMAVGKVAHWVEP